MTAPYERTQAPGPDAGGYPPHEPETREIGYEQSGPPPAGYAQPGYDPAAEQHPGYPPAPPRGYPGPRPQADPRERYRDDSSFGDEASRFNQQHLRTRETKEFFKTSEFMLTIVLALTMMISASVQENFDAPLMWRLLTGLFAAYVLSRGIAKAGTSRDR